MKGFVYLIHMADTPYWKVGVSHANPEERLKQIQTSCPGELALYSWASVEHPYKVEKEIHRTLSRFKVRGEWFRDDVDGTTIIHVFDNYTPMAGSDDAWDTTEPSTPLQLQMIRRTSCKSPTREELQDEAIRALLKSQWTCQRIARGLQWDLEHVIDVATDLIFRELKADEDPEEGSIDE